MTRRKNAGIKAEYFAIGTPLLLMLNFLLLLRSCSLTGIGYIGLSALFFWTLFSLTVSPTGSFIGSNLKHEISRGAYVRGFHLFRSGCGFSIAWSLCIAVLGFFFSDQIGLVLFRSLHISLIIKLCAILFFLYSVYYLYCRFIYGMGIPKLAKMLQFLCVVLIFFGSFIGSELFAHYGKVAADLLRNEEVMTVYKAAGALVGTGVAILLSLLVAILFRFLLRDDFSLQKRKDNGSIPGSLVEDAKVLLGNSLPMGLHKSALVLGLCISSLFICKQMAPGENLRMDMTLPGVLFGALMPSTYLLALLFRILTLPMDKPMKISAKNHDVRVLKAQIHGLIRGLFAIALPISVLFFVVGKSFVELLSGQTIPENYGNMICFGGFLIFGVSALLIFEKIKGLCNVESYSLLVALVALLVQCVFSGIFILAMDMSGYGVVLGAMIYLVIYCGYSIFHIYRYCHISMIYMHSVLLNMTIALIPGFILYVFYHAACKTWLPLAAFLVCGLVYVLFYIVLVSILPIFQGEEVRYVPLGSVLSSRFDVVSLRRFGGGNDADV